MGTRTSSRPRRAPLTAAPHAGDGWLHVLWDWTKSLGSALLLFLVLRTFVVQAYTIPSRSMEPTLLVGDFLMANNFLYGPHIPFTDWRLPGLRDPRVGDVVVFRPTYNTPRMDVVKRVIGVPGDTIQMHNRVVYRNGRPLREPYVDTIYAPDEPIPYNGMGVPLPPEVDPTRYGYFWHLRYLAPGIDPRTYHPTRDNWGPLVVPSGHYLLLGDNRDESLDSRYMGFIPRDQIRAKAMFLYYSYDPTAARPFPRLLTAMRWWRIGHVIR